ncbi:S8 family serine peptidase [Arcanobacterium haemolyticum]|nr:S8 family serine peptidase [Arcanobacterium haemolyticum]
MTHYRKHVRALFACTAAAAVTLGATLPALADDTTPDSQPSQLTGPSIDELKEVAETNTTGKWFVQLSADPVSKQGSTRSAKSQIARQQAEFEKEVTDSDSDVEVHETFSELWNGVTVEATADDLDTIVGAKNVVAVYPVLKVDQPTDMTSAVSGISDPQMIHALAVTGADVAQNKYGITGKGIKIGIIDTGIDLDNPLFGGSGTKENTTPFPNNKIVAGYDYVGDDYDADPASDNYNPVPKPDSNPDDCKDAGHGTHVAGIAAGHGTFNGQEFKGVAPDALLGAYRVFGCSGSTDTSVMIQAMEQAAKDGMDVVNISIGAPTATWPSYPTAVAADNLADNGVVVVIAQGNSGESGMFYGGAPAVATKAIGVGSVENGYFLQQSFRIGDREYGYEVAGGAPEPPKSGTLPITTYSDEDMTGAVDLEGTPFTGKAVLVARGGESTFYDKAIAAQNDGAAAVLIYNNEDSVFGAFVDDSNPITIPVVTLTQPDGLDILASVRQGDTELEWSDEYVNAKDPNGGLVSAFSSWGPSADLALKPELLAPGGNIISGAPMDAGDGSGFTGNSGTSMASPHVAGAAALLLAANPALNPDLVPEILENTATPVVYSPDNTTASAQVWRQGAGLINIPAAITEATSGASVLGEPAQPSSITPGTISLRDSDENEITPVTITNNRDTEETYELGVNSTGALNSDELGGVAGYRTPADLTSAVSYTVNGQAVTSVSVAPHSSVTINVSIDEPEVDFDGVEVKKGTFYGGWLTFTSSSQKKVVPFFGLKGDYEMDRPFLYSLDTYGDFFPEEILVEAGYNPADHIPNAWLAYFTACDKFLEDQCVQKNSGRAYANPDNVYRMEQPDSYPIFDYPTVNIALESPVTRIAIEVYKANADGTLGDILSTTPVRLEDAIGVGGEAWSWNGKYTAEDGSIATAPNGRYAFKIIVTKGVGHANTGNEADNYDSWISEPFIIRNIEVTPEAPTYADGTITIPEVEGVTYLVNGEKVTGQITVEPGSTVTVDAQPVDSRYVFAEGANVQWPFTHDPSSDANPSADSSPVDAATVAGNADEAAAKPVAQKKALAFTGASILGGLALVIVLTAGGTFLVRRREA